MLLNKLIVNSFFLHTIRILKTDVFLLILKSDFVKKQILIIFWPKETYIYDYL